jgi:membrane protein implicated in regulation of membrane protease activity
MKHKALIAAANRRVRWQKILHMASGVLALISGASITAIIVELTSSMSVKVFSAALAFLSGVISLVVTSYFDEKRKYENLRGSQQISGTLGPVNSRHQQARYQ